MILAASNDELRTSSVHQQQHLIANLISGRPCDTTNSLSGCVLENWLAFKAKMNKNNENLKDFIRDVPDFPCPGVMFRDITPLLKNPRAFEAAVNALASPFVGAAIDYIVAVESRGFIFGAAVARQLNIGFVPVRKIGKLPWETKSVAYELEYGCAELEIHSDAIEPGSKVLMIDDLLATGGTMAAACQLVRNFDAEVYGIAFLVELTYLRGRQHLTDYNITTILKY